MGLGMTAEGTLSHPKGNVIGVLPRALSSKEIDKARGETGISSAEGQGDQVVSSEDSYEGRIDLQLVDDMHTVSDQLCKSYGLTFDFSASRGWPSCRMGLWFYQAALVHLKRCATLISLYREVIIDLC